MIFWSSTQYHIVGWGAGRGGGGAGDEGCFKGMGGSKETAITARRPNRSPPINHKCWRRPRFSAMRAVKQPNAIHSNPYTKQVKKDIKPLSKIIVK